MLAVRTTTDLSAEVYFFSLSDAYPPKVLFDQSFEYGQGISVPNYDVLPDGCFVMLRAESGGASFRVIRHWADGLKGK